MVWFTWNSKEKKKQSVISLFCQRVMEEKQTTFLCKNKFVKIAVFRNNAIMLYNYGCRISQGIQ